MAILDEIVLKRYAEDVTKKSVLAINETELVKEFLKYEELNHDFLLNSSAYEVANTLRSFKFWYDNKNSVPSNFRPKAKEVYYIDLGAFNIKYEEGFVHSCLIIKRFGDKVMVVPGSTKKYAMHNFLIEPVNAGDGFVQNTGVLIDQIRCVSVSRIVGTKLGTMTLPTFKKIETKIFEAFLGNKLAEFEQLERDNTQLQQEKNDLEAKIEKHKKEIEKIKTDLQSGESK